MDVFLVLVGCLAVVGIVFSVLLLVAIWYYFEKKIKAQEKVISELEGICGNFEEELTRIEEDSHREMGDRGRKGVEIREQNKEMRAAALAEGREVISGPGSLDQKKEGIFRLIQKYPLVAEGVAKALNREYGISKMLGMPEDALIQQVATMAAQAMSKPAQPEQTASWKD